MRAHHAAGLVSLAGLALALCLLTWDDPRAGSAAGPAAARPDRTPERQGAQPLQPTAGPRAEPELGERSERRGASPAEEASAREGAAEPTALGRVVDELGRPVPGAEVRVGDLRREGRLVRARPETGSSRTDPEGRFSVPSPAGPRVWLEVRAPGFVPLAEPREGQLAGLELELGSIALAPGALLSGHVVDDLGRALAGATIHLAGAEGSGSFFDLLERGELLATSAADGSFLVDVLAPGPWRVLVLSAEHPDQEFEGSGEASDSSGVVFQLRPGHSIAGRVVSDGETPLDLVRVRALPAEGIELDSVGGARPWRDVACGADGSFWIGGLPSADGLHQLRAYVGDTSLFGTDWRSEPVLASPGEQALVLRLQNELTVAFRAVDPDGLRLAGCEVHLVHALDGDEALDALAPDDERLSVDAATGVTSVRGVRPPSSASRTTLVLRHEGYRTFASEPVSLADVDAYDFGTLTLERRPQITVRVTEAAGGRPLADASVLLELEESSDASVGAGGLVHALGVLGEHEASTDADGLARLPRIEGQAFTLQAFHPDYAPSAERRLTLAYAGPAGEPPIELTLVPGAEVDVLVVTPDGQPAPGFEVRAEGEDSNHARRSDREGRARFSGLSAALYRFTVEGLPGASFHFGSDEPPPAAGPHTSELQVQAGGSYALTLQRPALGALFGRVTEGGRPLAGAVCQAEARGAFVIPGLTAVPETRTDAAGNYRLEPIDGGSYVLVVAHPARAMDQRLEVQVAEGPRRVDVDLPLTSISGRVSAPDGLPVAGATIAVADLEADSASRKVSVTLAAGDGLHISVHAAAAPGVQSDERGAFELRGVRAGTPLAVSATHPDFLGCDAEPFVLGAGERREGLDLRLGAAGRLLVAVPGAGAGVQVVAVPAPPERSEEPAEIESDDGAVEAQTDARGEALLSPLVPGTWTVTVISPDGRVSAGQVARVEAGQTATLSAPLP